MVNLFFICLLNRQANLTNEHCTSESVFVACAHIASVNILKVQISHPSPITFLTHHFSAITLVYLNPLTPTSDQYNIMRTSDENKENPRGLLVDSIPNSQH